MILHNSQTSYAVSENLRRPLTVWIAGVLGVVLIGGLDYFTGVELRVFPLYYAPISLVAWYRGRSAALILAALSAVSWFGSNQLAGLQFSRAALWVANTLVQFTSFVLVGLLIATLRATLMREQRLSRIDPLTSLLNTRAFYEEANRFLALCRRKGRPITVAYIDLDGFKAVNDSLGHQAGDDVLRRVAELLHASIRPSDLSARLGGDEFAVLLSEAGPDDAAATLERLRSLLADTLGSSPCPVTASIGGVTFITLPDNVEDMVRHTDAGMYVAKTKGKNRVHLEVVSHSGDRIEAGR